MAERLGNGLQSRPPRFESGWVLVSEKERERAAIEAAKERQRILDEEKARNERIAEEEERARRGERYRPEH